MSVFVNSKGMFDIPLLINLFIPLTELIERLCITVK